MVFTWLPAHVPPHLKFLSWSPLSPATLPTCSWLTGQAGGWATTLTHPSMTIPPALKSSPGQKEGTATSTQSTPGQKEGTAAPEELTAQPLHPYSCSDFPADSRRAHHAPVWEIQTPGSRSDGAASPKYMSPYNVVAFHTVGCNRWGRAEMSAFLSRRLIPAGSAARDGTAGCALTGQMA